VGGFAVAAGGDEDAFGGAFILQGAVEVADGGDANGVAVALSLDDDLAAHDRSGVHGDAVHAAVAGGPGLAGVQAHAGEQVLNQAFELGRAHGQQVGALVQAADDVGFLDEAGVGHVELEDRPDRGEFFGFAGDPGAEMAEAGGRVDATQVEFGEGFAGGAQGEQAGVDGAAGGRVVGGDHAVEHDGVDVAPAVGFEDLVDDPERCLGDDRGVLRFHLCLRACSFGDGVGGLDVAVGLDGGEGVDAGRSYSTTSWRDAGT